MVKNSAQQMSFLPADDIECAARTPAPSPKTPIHPLPRHPYNSALGDRTPKAVEHLKATLTASRHAIEVRTLDAMVLSDWDPYLIAVEQDLPIKISRYDGFDPLAFACSEVLHGLGSTKRQNALRVVRAFPWAEPGRPKNPVSDTGFLGDGIRPLTAADMAALAECSEETIHQARRIFSFGLAERVMDGSFSFQEALRNIKRSRPSGSRTPGSSAFDIALQHQEAGQEEGIDQGALNDKLGDSPDAQCDQCRENDELRLENVRLKTQVRALTQENSRLERELENVRQERDHPTELAPVLNDQALRIQITQLESRLHSQEERAKQAQERAQAAETELAHIRRQIPRTA